MHPDVQVVEERDGQSCGRSPPETGHPHQQEAVDVHAVAREAEDALAHERRIAPRRVEVVDAESALEKATASRGLLTVHHNEADLYGYPDENADAVAAFQTGRSAFLDWNYGLQITRLVMAAYLAAERKQTIDLTDPAIQQELESYVPLIQQGRGAEVLF